ncbi:MAG TPA: phytoene/squalene synthase family protein [Solirubrobacteraceae bacterium]
MLAASTFNVGVSLLPDHLQADARRLYYLLRTIDDLVDEADPRAEERVCAVERWARGEPAETPETRTLRDLAARYPFPREAFAEFCRGMRHDLRGATIETEADLERYCGQAGGTVGTMLASLLGTSSAEGAEKMATLGSAMQWTNILRDIDEDLERGRVYIARTTIARFGFPAPGSREDLLRDQIRRADALYAEGLAAIPLLSSGRRAMGLSATLYREILRQIERDGFGRKAGRAKIPAWRKRLLVASYDRTERARRAARPDPDDG